MSKVFFAIIAVCFSAAGVLGQGGPGPKTSTAGAAESAKSFAAENALAGLALSAHGGDRLRKMKTLVVRGSVDVTMSSIAQAIPATFINGLFSCALLISSAANLKTVSKRFTSGFLISNCVV